MNVSFKRIILMFRLIRNGLILGQGWVIWRVCGFWRKSTLFLFIFSKTFLVWRVFKELIVNLVPMFKNVVFDLINFLVNIFVLLGGKALLVRSHWRILFLRRSLRRFLSLRRSLSLRRTLLLLRLLTNLLVLFTLLSLKS